MEATGRVAKGGLRTFGVEEELLLVNRDTLELSRGAHAVMVADAAHRRSGGAADDPREPRLTLEVKEEQIEVVSAPGLHVDELERNIRWGRRIASEAAGEAGATIAALGTSPYVGHAHLVANERYMRLAQNFGRTLEEQLTCGFHVHVAVADLEECVAVLDRIRVWLPIVLALSANSPFWHGGPTGFASYRYQVWGRWPMTGPNTIFGSAAGYRERVGILMESGVPLDEHMLYFDARFSSRIPTVEVRVADVCLDASHAATVAGVVRALVETAGREWRAGRDPDPTASDVLRVWQFQASRAGLSGDLVDATLRRAVPAHDAVAGLLAHVRPALADSGEVSRIEEGLAAILAEGTGSAAQLEAFARRGNLSDVVADAVARTAKGTGR